MDLKPMPTSKTEIKLEAFMLGTLSAYGTHLPRAELLKACYYSKKAMRSFKKVSIMLIGVSGVGKSSTINHLFSVNLAGTSGDKSETKSTTSFCITEKIPSLGVSNFTVNKDCGAMAKCKPNTTRSTDMIWLIGHPCDIITGARLPSGRDVMQNFVYFQRKQKLTVAQSAEQVHDQLLPFWIKSRLPVRNKPDIIQKIKDLYSQHFGLMKHRSRNNAKDQQNQKEYNEKLDILFDISHADSDNLIKNEEDRQFLKLQKESRTGCIRSVDNKMFFRDKRSAKRKERLVLQQRAASAGQQLMQADAETVDKDEETAESSKLCSSDDEESMDEFVVKSPTNDRPTKQPKCAGVMTSKVAAVYI